MIHVGQYAEIRKEISAENIRLYAELTGDYNPIHFDATYAAGTVFGKPIAHGPYVLTLLTTLFANELPGPGTVYLSHEVRFIKPVYIGDQITARVTVQEIRANGHLFMETTCHNQHGDLVITGVARLKKL